MHLPIGGRPRFSHILTHLKGIDNILGSISRRLRCKPRRKRSSHQLALPFPRPNDSLLLFWQPRFYDFNLWSQSKFVEKLHYMYTNPVKKKLVIHPKGWPWSSFSFYAKKETRLVRTDSVH